MFAALISFELEPMQEHGRNLLLTRTLRGLRGRGNRLFADRPTPVTLGGVSCASWRTVWRALVDDLRSDSGMVGRVYTS